MNHHIAISEVAEVNPRTPQSLLGEPSRRVHFVPMAKLHEDGHVEPNGDRAISEVSKGYTYFENGDVLVAKITPCMENGKAAFISRLPLQVAFGSTEFHVLRPSDRIDGKYLFYMVWNSTFRAEASQNMTGSAGQKRVPADFFNRFKIPLPPLGEQKRIAAILDKADAIRRKRREAAMMAVALRKSLFLSMFGDSQVNAKRWPVKAFSDLWSGDLRNGISPASLGPVTGKVLILSAITGSRFDACAIKTSTFAEPFSDDQLVRFDEFLICRGNGNRSLVGIGRFPTRSFDDVVFPDTMIAAQIDPAQVDREYLEEVWHSAYVRGQLEQAARTTNGTYKVNQKMLSAVRLPLPPVEYQRDFGRRVARARALHAKLDDPVADGLFDSLVQRAFRGEL